MQRRRRPKYHLPKFMVCLAWYALAPCCCSPCLAGETPTDEPIALLTDGRAVASRLHGIAENGDWLFNQSGQAVTVARNQLVFWGAYRDRFNRSWIMLQDGSLLVADLLGIEGNEVVIAGRLWPETRLPRSLVRAILFRPPLDSSARDALNHMGWRDGGPRDTLKRIYWNLLTVKRDPLIRAWRWGIRDFLLSRFGDAPAAVKKLT